MTKGERPLVHVAMVTYNHGEFIADAIESALAQQCKFPFTLIISDDCSTDNTGSICKMYQERYPEKIVFIQQRENQGLVLNYKSVFERCDGEFISILEGDDYWIDPLKLQKQVDVLTQEESIGLVHTGFAVKEADGKYRTANLGSQSGQFSGNLYEKVMRDEITFCPLTVTFRGDLFRKFVDYNFCIENKVWTIDAFLWPELANHCTIAYLPETTGIYRRTRTAATSTTLASKFIWYYETGLKMKLYYLEKYPIAGFTPAMAKEKLLMTLVRNLVTNGHHTLARQYANELQRKGMTSKLLFLSTRSLIGRMAYSITIATIQHLSSLKQLILRS